MVKKTGKILTGEGTEEASFSFFVVFVDILNFLRELDKKTSTQLKSQEQEEQTWNVKSDIKVFFFLFYQHSSKI